MKKIILVYGCIAGLIAVSMGLILTTIFCTSGDFKNGMIYGYASQILSFSLIFVGVKNYRDKHNKGVISFGKAFKVGMFISLIAATFYVVGWLANYHLFMPDFYDKYFARSLEQLKSSGASAATIAEETVKMNKMAEMSKNEFFIIIMTYAEVLLPVGLVIPLIAALSLKRKMPKTDLT